MVDLFRKIKKCFFQNNLAGDSNSWSGNYRTWSDALNECTGYDSELILTSCLKSLIKVRNGEFKYERDSVLFEKKQYSFGLLTGLLISALENNCELDVLDFGGSLGSTYFQNRDINGFKSVKWSIVEQPNFVKCGKEYFENDELKFYYNVEECLKHRSPNVVILSGVLQYVENFDVIISQINNQKIDYIVVDRTTFVSGGTHRIVKQVVPESIYKASYPVHLFLYDEFISAFSNYDVLMDFNSFCDPLNHILEANIEINWKGMILQLRK
jgi:putative methyltransferase (TIGR04325 family)